MNYMKNIHMTGRPDKLGVGIKITLLAALELLLLKLCWSSMKSTMGDYEPNLELQFLKLSFDDLDFCELVEQLVTALAVIFAAESSVEDSVLMRMIFPRPDSPGKKSVSGEM